ncbi:MAG: hypothetical protein JW937_09520 [Candidatus Omnitrophica bacterium]|nr:hypothetical protein [Candidatus Omnitrophota bacterium]
MKIGSADFADNQVVEELGMEFRAIARLLRDHARHEEIFIHPLLEEKSPKSKKPLLTQHREHEESLCDIETRWKELKEAHCSLEERMKMGLEFYRSYNFFVAEYLMHLDHDEAKTMAELWKYCSDEELTAQMDAFEDSRGAEDAMQDLEVLLPALNVHERAAMLAAVRKDEPQEVFEGVCDIAEHVLEPPEWEELKIKLGILEPS